MSEVCKFNMGKPCDGNCDDCEDITEVPDYSKLKKSLEFIDDDIVNGEE